MPRFKSDQNLSIVAVWTAEAYPVDSGPATYSVVKGRDVAVFGALSDGPRANAFAIPGFVS